MHSLAISNEHYGFMDYASYKSSYDDTIRLMFVVTNLEKYIKQSQFELMSHVYMLVW